MQIKLDKLIGLKNNGVTAVASVVKSHFDSTYYHVVYIDDLIKNGGKWIPAVIISFPSGARGRIGISGNKIDWTKTVKLADIR